MTVKLDTYTFSPKPQITIGSQADLADQQKYGGGTTKDYTGCGPIIIKLEGELTGANRYTDRDALMAILTAGAKVDFYADDITYGSVGSPKSVWVKGYEFAHASGEPDPVPFTILLEEET